MSECANCKAYLCREGKNLPGECPGNSCTETLAKAFACYEGKDLEIAQAGAAVEADGYGSWPRVREIMEFAARLGCEKIGLAFCVGLREEARAFAEVLHSNGFEVHSAICKTGSVNKTRIGVTNRVNPESFEAMCNPIAQAALLDEAGCGLNVILGLCVGHDTLFIRHSKAPVTVLAVKDRVLAHNPLGALYAGHYYGKKLQRANKK